MVSIARIPCTKCDSDYGSHEYLRLHVYKMHTVPDLESELLETRKALSEREADASRANAQVMQLVYEIAQTNKKVKEALKRESEANARIAELQGLAYYLLNHHDKVADELEADLREHGWEIDYLNGFVSKNALKEVADEQK